MKIFNRGHERQVAEFAQVLNTPPGTQLRKRQWHWGMWLANLVAMGVGAVAGFVSWQHLSALGTKLGATAESAFLTPFTIDGMIVVGTLEMRQARKEDRPAKVWAYGAVLIGVIGTIAGNVRAAEAGNLAAQLYFASPAVAFLISVEVLFGKPLSRNLWEIIGGWWRNWRAWRNRTVQTDPAPDRPQETVQPVRDPAPEEPHAEPAESPAPAPAPRPGSSTKPQPRRPGRRAATGRRADAEVVGTRQNPARMVAGVLLEGEALRAEARARVSQAVSDGRRREGLGAWVARQFQPPMSDNWGLARVAEVLDTPKVPADPAPFIDPLPVAEQAEPIGSAWWPSDTPESARV